MLCAYFEVAPKDIWSDLKGDQLNFTLSQRKAREKKEKDSVPAKICEAQINLELDKVQLCSHTLQSCGSLIYLSVSS